MIARLWAALRPFSYDRLKADDPICAARTLIAQGFDEIEQAARQGKPLDPVERRRVEWRLAEQIVKAIEQNRDR